MLFTYYIVPAGGGEEDALGTGKPVDGYRGDREELRSRRDGTGSKGQKRLGSDLAGPAGKRDLPLPSQSRTALTAPTTDDPRVGDRTLLSGISAYETDRVN